MKRLLFSLALFTTIAFQTYAQRQSDWFPNEDESIVPEFPLDPAITHGVLDNGLKYFILPNKIPAGQAEFYLLMRVGSILEKDSQCGFSHLIETMSTMGTKNFPGSSLMDALSRHGIAQENVHTYTSFDETAFQLYQVPVTREKKATIDTCLLVLHDWSSCVSFNEESLNKAKLKIDGERSTVKTPTMKMFENVILPKLMPETHYANRHPIGDKKVLDRCKLEQVKEYYEEWYRRTDLQALIVVGDVDHRYVEQRIKEIWKDVPAPVNPTPRTYEQIEDNPLPLVAVASDKDYHQNMIRFGAKVGKISPKLRNSQVNFTRVVIRDVQFCAFKNRVQKLLEDPDCPITDVTVEIEDYLVSKSKRGMKFSFVYKDNCWKEALHFVMVLVADIYDNGFTPEEIEAAKNTIRDNLNKAYQEKDKRTNKQLADNLRNHFLESTPFAEVTLVNRIANQLLDNLPYEAYVEIFQQLVDRQRSQYIFCLGQDKPGVVLPTEKELLKEFSTFIFGPEGENRKSNHQSSTVKKIVY